MTVIFSGNPSMTIPILLYLQKAENQAFPTVLGSGGRRQGLLNEIICCAKCDWAWFHGVFQAIENSASFSEYEMFCQFPRIFLREWRLAKTISFCDEPWHEWCFLVIWCELSYLAIYCEPCSYKIHAYVSRNWANILGSFGHLNFRLAKTKLIR